MRTALAIVVGCLVLVLPACGGDDETTTTTTETATGASGATGGSREEERNTGRPGGTNSGPSDFDRASAAVEAAIGSGDPEAACSTSVTEAYVKSSYGNEDGCRAAVESLGAIPVDVKRLFPLEDPHGDPDVTRSGGIGATAVPSAGPNKGEKLSVRLVYEGGVWKVDFVRSDAPAGP